MIQQRHKKRPPKSKHWCFTINNYTRHDTPSCDNVQYIVLGREIASTGMRHYQGYVCYYTQLRATQVSKLMPRAHIEIKYANSTPLQAATYCMKDGDYVVYGKLPLTKEQGTMERWDNARESARVGDFESIPSDMLIRYYHNLKRYHQDNPTKPGNLTKMDNVWIIAPTGYGKSYYARKKWPDNYDKSPNKWFVGYKGEKTIICDDFSPQQCFFLYWYLKRWADIYPYPMESKGGGKLIRPDRIVITSQYTIDACFDDDETRSAIKRRFRVKHLKHWVTGKKYEKTIVYQPSTQLFTSNYKHL